MDGWTDGRMDRHRIFLRSLLVAAPSSLADVVDY